MIKWFGNPTTESVRQAMHNGEFGAVITPAQGMYAGLDCVELIVDNGRFGDDYPGDVQFLAFAAKLPDPAMVRFVVAPDVVGDAAATLKFSAPFLPVIRKMGYRVAFAAQNGLTPEMTPWDEFDVLFLGGVPECPGESCGFVRPKLERDWKYCPKCCRQLAEWKLSAAARELVSAALSLGKDAHIGRVNGPGRLAIAEAMGVSTADGTRLAWGPDANLPHVRAMLRKVNDQGVLWEAVS